MPSTESHFQPHILRKSAEQHLADPMEERLFVDRVCRLAAARELRFRRSDIERFHLSVKTGTITVLTGPPGTGKSSLATVYGEALRGRDTSQRPSHHIVSVNPTWMDGRDLFGYLAAGDRRFVPAESGLFEFLVAAQLEEDELGAHAGVFLALLDEINLAQVEHYFGEVMLALERRGPDRAIQLFSSDAAAKECAFRRYGRLRLSQNLRFVGTMNEDETTRQISARFSDRVNQIRLEARSTIADSTPEYPSEVDLGQPTTLADFERWSVEDPLEAEVAEFIDRIRPLLERLDAPLSARARNGIDRYIRCSGSLARQCQALDYQIAQRMLPRVRLIGSRIQESALSDLRSLLETAAFRAPESLAMIDAMQLRLRDTIVDDD
jgi:MoxR-like ATPase